MPKTIQEKDNVYPEILFKSGMYRELLTLNRNVGKIPKSPIEELRGSIQVSKKNWIKEVVKMENWLEG